MKKKHNAEQNPGNNVHKHKDIAMIGINGLGSLAKSKKLKFSFEHVTISPFEETYIRPTA